MTSATSSFTAFKQSSYVFGVGFSPLYFLLNFSAACESSEHSSASCSNTAGFPMISISSISSLQIILLIPLHPLVSCMRPFICLLCDHAEPLPAVCIMVDFIVVIRTEPYCQPIGLSFVPPSLAKHHMMRLKICMLTVVIIAEHAQIATVFILRTLNDAFPVFLFPLLFLLLRISDLWFHLHQVLLSLLTALHTQYLSP